jgi:hypothetical protein
MALDRTGVLVVRVWIEEPDHAFRARLTESADLNQLEWATRSVGNVEAATSFIRDWLEAFAVSTDRTDDAA